MTNSILEITENEYLIKLNRTKFDLSFIRSLLKMVEVSNPSEDSYYMPEDGTLAQIKIILLNRSIILSLEEKSETRDASRLKRE